MSRTGRRLHSTSDAGAGEGTTSWSPPPEELELLHTPWWSPPPEELELHEGATATPWSPPPEELELHEGATATTWSPPPTTWSELLELVRYLPEFCNKFAR